MRKSILVLLTLLLLAPPAYATTLVLTWDAPTQDVEGNPITDPVAYVVHWGPSSNDGNAEHVYPNTSELISETTYTTAELPDGTYYFAVTAQWTDREVRSAYSNELEIILDGKHSPQPPQALVCAAATINGVDVNVENTETGCVIRYTISQ